MATFAPQRLHDLQTRFSELESQLADTPEKTAISLLHAMIQESLQTGALPRAASDNGDQRPGVTLEQIATLYKHAPAMAGEAENTGLSVGKKAPDFSLPDANGRQVRLADYGGQTVVLVFYPLDWSPGCSDQLSLYQSEAAEFERLGAQLVCISVDSLYSHGAWAAVRGLTFPLLADFHPKGQVARLYGVMRESDGFSERALYIIAADGVIRYKHISPQINRLPDIYELLDQLQQVESKAVEAVKP